MRNHTPKTLATAFHEAIRGVSAKEREDVIKNFVAMLGKKHMLGKSKEIIEAYKKMSLASDGIVEAEVTTALPLADGDEEKLKKYLKKDFKADDIVIHHKLDEQLLGGIKIKIGDTIIDNSLQGRLTTLKHHLAK